MTLNPLAMAVFDPGVPVDPPFACPPDIMIELPVPPSVNRSRRINWAARPKFMKWLGMADKCVLAARCRVRDSIRNRCIEGPFEAIITLSEAHTKMDLDNGVKALIDFARRVELIEDDCQKFFRRLTVQWGEAPTGCKLVLRPMERS